MVNKERPRWQVAETDATQDATVGSSYRFRCLYCGQRLRAFDDLAGEEIECPRCAETLRVIEKSQAAKMWEFETEVERLFSVEELLRLQHEGRSVFVYTDGATTKNCWEFGLAGELIQSRLEPFRELLHDLSVVGTPGPATVADADMYVARIDAKLDEFSVIVGAIHTLSVDRAPQALFADSLAEVMGLVHLVADTVIRLLAFHQSLRQLELPSQRTYQRVSQVMASWSGHCWDELWSMGEQLRAMHRGQITPHTSISQLSVIPPTYYEFVILRGQLGI